MRNPARPDELVMLCAVSKLKDYVAFAWTGPADLWHIMSPVAFVPPWGEYYPRLCTREQFEKLALVDVLLEQTQGGRALAPNSYSYGGHFVHSLRLGTGNPISFTASVSPESEFVCWQFYRGDESQPFLTADKTRVDLHWTQAANAVARVVTRPKDEYKLLLETKVADPDDPDNPDTPGNDCPGYVVVEDARGIYHGPMRYYPKDGWVRLRPVANPGYRFVKWETSEDVTWITLGGWGTPPPMAERIAVCMQADTTIMAVFEPHVTLEAFCDKLGEHGSFGENPEIFVGPKTHFGEPDQPPPYWWLPGTYEDPSSQALKIFFKFIKDSNDEPGPFNIELKANLPECIPDELLNITWSLREGPPGSGSFDKTDERNVQFQNPTEGGLYKFQMEMHPPGCGVMRSDAWVLLPKAGGEVSDWMINEVPSLANRAADWETDVRAVAAARGLKEKQFLRTAFQAIATAYFDYQGIVGSPTKRYSFTDSDRPVDHVPNPAIPGMAGKKWNGDWDEPSYATLKGIVVHRAKINNAMYAVWGRQLGFKPWMLKAGAIYNAHRRRLWDDASSQSAIELGIDLFRAHSKEESLSAVLTKKRAKGIQTPDEKSGLNDVNLWPDTTPVSSGFTLENMPTDYDTLKQGADIIPKEDKR